MLTKYYTVTIEIIECASCGQPFGMTEDYIQRRRDDGQTFYCPSGHRNLYNDTTLRRLKRRVETLEGIEEELRESVKTERKAKIVARATATRTKNRATKGVCLYCNRTVKQMAKHVVDKHPEHV